MEQIMLQTGSTQFRTASQAAGSTETSATDGTSSFESLLAEKYSGQDEVSSENPKPDHAGVKEDPAENTGLLEQAAANLAGSLVWGNLMVETDFSQEKMMQDLAVVLDATQLPAADTAQQVPAEATALPVELPDHAAGEEMQAVGVQAVPQSKEDTASDGVSAEPAAQPAEAVDQPAVPVKTESGTEENLSEKPETSPQPASQKQDVEVVDAEASPTEPLFRNVDVMPVKVGDGAVLDTENTEFDRNLSQTIQQAADQGLQKVEIELNPQHLGKVVVEMTRDPEGLLQVVLHTENQHAARLLQEHAGTLQELLQGNHSGQVQLEVSAQESQSDTWQPPDQQHSGGQPREQRNHRQHTEDFLNQLRLGLLQTGQE